MDVDGFWALVERSAQETVTKEERVAWLEERLSRLTAEEIVDYEAWFTLCANRACTWDLYAACWTITGFGSSAGFEYFVDWLISLGRDVFEKLTERPDRLVELPEVQRLFELSWNFSHRRISASEDGAVRLVRLTRVRRQRWPDELRTSRGTSATGPSTHAGSPAWGGERTRAWSFHRKASGGRRTRERRHRQADRWCSAQYGRQ
ncbi:DUF4240 domain-containing protein [Nonomuraea spiralis]|uniref:DUF4240 domain-containing protein n=1 Tax=Nonomuraea spiralis TaxID=46182 RepID=UPI00379660B8